MRIYEHIFLEGILYIHISSKELQAAIPHGCFGNSQYFGFYERKPDLVWQNP